ncbi:hypothetical protein OG563_26895 [Nocardia vinacea]|uniref:Uncharacterized protein n=1 Tax=Nocardia vinacea TaxID=96468 RepID=A0ABZ1YLK9_9NOCA|nr:hypothetical protein [Nocardia vinacea]
MSDPLDPITTGDYFTDSRHIVRLDADQVEGYGAVLAIVEREGGTEIFEMNTELARQFAIDLLKLADHADAMAAHYRDADQHTEPR